MLKFLRPFVVLLPALTLSAQRPDARTVVFEQAGFPAVASENLSHATLAAAFAGAEFADIEQLRSGAALKDAHLLVMPYGSAVPTAGWPAIRQFLHGGGNLLLIGGQPLRVPVDGDHDGSFTEQPAQDSYSRELGFLHTYPAPLPTQPLHFAWRDGYRFLPQVKVQPTTVYVEEGRLNGLGYLDASDGTHLAAPVIVSDHLGGGGQMNGARVVALPFTAANGFWSSEDGKTLLRTAAGYAFAGATGFNVELQYTALRPGEMPAVTLHLSGAGTTLPEGKAQVELLQSGHIAESRTVDLGGMEASTAVEFTRPLRPGVYTLRATWTPSASRQNIPQNTPQEFAENGFVVEDLKDLETGPALGARGDFLTLGGAPFFPVGTNYFSTDANGWDFSGPRNGATWERDFADMERHGVSFVRTGVWMPSFSRFVEASTGEANERFLRNLEAVLSAAHRHNIVVNFTCFAFTPHGQDRYRRSSDTGSEPPPPNPYLDETTVRQEQEYVVSVVRRFRKLPFLSYDLINEPSFSNPRNIFHGNIPNGDPAEVTAWHKWLRARYGTLAPLAEAWRVSPDELISFDSIPLPRASEITFDRYGAQAEVRAFDYNLFAQDMFSGWVRGMVETIRRNGSTQLINVGQDEGGVTNRLLNQFYATAGVSFTTNHTYWSDDALLWDSVAAKRPGLPNITGETGYQPAWNPDGSWRYDELTGTALEERKWALGFAAGSSGAVQWDWDREVDFGMQRSDGSAKVWEAMMRDLGSFAKAAAPQATGIRLPEVAIILPQSLQLSVYNSQALAAQQMAVRVLYQRNRVEAYAVGEFQTDTLGSPKLIIVPSAYGLNGKAWADIQARVRAGAVLLLSGPFAGDEHLHETGRAQALGLPAQLTELLLRENTLNLPGGGMPLLYEGLKTTMLDRDTLPDGKTWAELSLGEGKVLFSAFPLELNSNADAVAAAYEVALKAAGVQRTYTTTLKDAGILICPTRLPHATLYVLTSESPTQAVSFTDTRSGRTLTGTLEAGRAALLLLGEHGDVLASYHWPSGK
ncbi:MAG TPA: beta-galactosidase [Acidobacteriaceae bacterium]|nr:beta-galactosidase [Acidobacteriaceae bacterium]